MIADRTSIDLLLTGVWLAIYCCASWHCALAALSLIRRHRFMSHPALFRASQRSRLHVCSHRTHSTTPRTQHCRGILNVNRGRRRAGRDTRNATIFPAHAGVHKGDLVLTVSTGDEAAARRLRVAAALDCGRASVPVPPEGWKLPTDELRCTVLT
jgi:hypothetical protein